MLKHLERTIVASLASLMLAAAPAAAMDNTLVQKGAPDLTKARALIKKENWAAASAELERLNTAGKPHADVLNLLGYTARKQARFKASLGYYQAALKLDPKHLGAHVYLGELYIQTGAVKKALAQGQTLARLCPKGCAEYDTMKAALAAAKY